MPRRKKAQDSDEDEDDDSYHEDEESSQESDNDDDEDNASVVASEDSDFGPSSKKKKPATRRGGKRAQTKRKHVRKNAKKSTAKSTKKTLKEDTSSGDDSHHDSVSDDDFEESNKTRSRLSGSQKPNVGKPKISVLVDNKQNKTNKSNISVLVDSRQNRTKKTLEEESDEESSYEDKEDDDFIENESSSEDDESFHDDEYDDDEEHNPRTRSSARRKSPPKKSAIANRTKRSKTRTVRRPTKSPHFEDSDDENEEESVASVAESEPDDNKKPQRTNRGPVRSTRSKPTYLSFDRSLNLRRKTAQFSYKESSDNEDDKNEDSSDDNEREKIKPVNSKRGSKKVINDDEDEFIPDDNKIDDYESDKDLDADSDEGIEESDIGDPEIDDESDQDDVKNRSKPVQIQPNMGFPTLKIPYCPSTEDVITFEALPKKHICFFSPDQNSRQCFCLSTLRMIALSTTNSKVQQFGKPTFLQPPHFRTVMSDDLIDQIASRFGRAALDLNGPFYQRKNKNEYEADEKDDDNDDDDMDYYDHDDALIDSEAFIDKVQSYVKASMGGRDVYVCPVCYTIAHKHLCDFHGKEGKHDDENKSVDQQYPLEYIYDPLSVLGYEDDDAFEVASAFCFTRLNDLKTHLRQEHEVDTRDVTGNDLYARYKIRAPDGLLQRYLNRYGSSSQGMMMSYWMEGHNFSFLLLLSQIPHAELCRQILFASEEGDNDEETIRKAEKYLQPSNEFFDSILESKDVWDMISRPFQKGTKEEINAFIASDDDDEGNGNNRSMYQTFNMRSALDEHDENRKAAAYYENRMSASPPGEDGYESDDIIDNTDLVFENESDEYDEPDDDWEKDITSRLESKIISSQKKRPGGRLSNCSAKRILKGTRDSSSGNASPIMFGDEKKDNNDDFTLKGESNNRSRKRVVLDDDDESYDEIEDFNSTPRVDTTQASLKSQSSDLSGAPLSAIRKRLVINESDNDDE